MLQEIKTLYKEEASPSESSWSREGSGSISKPVKKEQHIWNL